MTWIINTKVNVATASTNVDQHNHNTSWCSCLTYAGLIDSGKSNVPAQPPKNAPKI